MLSVAASKNPFGIGVEHFYFEPGKTLLSILDESCPEHRNYRALVFIGDHYIEPRFYHCVRPKAGHVIAINIAPHGGKGGKNPLRTIIGLAISFAAPYAAGAILGTSLAATAAFGSITYGTLLSGALTMVGNLAMNALIPTAKPKAPSLSGGGSKVGESQTYFIQGARNRLLPFGNVPEVLGTHRIVPPQGAQPYTEVSADIVYSRQLFVNSLGKILVKEEKLGDTPLNAYEGVTFENFFNGNLSDPSTIIPARVMPNDLNITLERMGDYSVVVTAQDTDEVIIQISFPQGLYETDEGEGEIQRLWVDYDIRYRPEEGGEYVSVPYHLERTANFAFAIAHRFQMPARGQYRFEIRNRTQEFDSVSLGYGANEMIWVGLQSFQNESPVKANYPVSGKALRIKGTKQLSGAVDDYNCVATRLLPDWDGNDWVDDQPTSNPASIARYLLTSPFSFDPLDGDEYDSETLEDWHAFCVENGFTYNAYLDYDADLEELLAEVAAAGRASFTIIDNKYTLIIDRPTNRVVNHISQRKSYNYSYTRSFSKEVHALRVPFINSEKGYVQDEVIVYADGYNKGNATEFFSQDFPGVVTAAQAWKLGRYYLAYIKYRPDMHKVTMDIEHLVGTRGKRVKFSHDVAMIGLGSGRVKSVILDPDDDTWVTGVIVDEEIGLEAGKSYGAEFWLDSGEPLKVSLNTVAGKSNQLDFLVRVAAGDAPVGGEIFSWGEAQAVTMDALIHSVIPQNELTAEVYLIRYAPEIYAADQGTVPDLETVITVPPEFLRPAPPVLGAIQSNEAVQITNIDGSISSRMVIRIINSNSGSIEPLVSIRRTGEAAYEDANVIFASESRIVLEGLQEGRAYDLQIRYRRVGGAALGSNSISAPLQLNGVVFEGNSAPPPAVQNFNINVRATNIFLSWDRVTVIDMDVYEIRFQPVLSGAAWEDATPFGPALSKEVTTAVYSVREGTYLIKARDRQGNYSEQATLAVTSIGAQDGLNQIFERLEHDDPVGGVWGGTKSGTRVSDGFLMLGGIDTIDDWSDFDMVPDFDFGDSGMANEGFYYGNVIDLGEIDRPVLSSSLVTTGANLLLLFDDIADVDAIENWDGGSPSQYEVQTLINYTLDDPNDPDAVWSGFEPLNADRTIEMRAVIPALRLRSLASGITPAVQEFTFRIDVTDRFESGTAIEVGVDGLFVEFEQAFSSACVPHVAVAINNMLTGDRYVIDDEGPTGFFIRFYDAIDAPVIRRFSFNARGYGRAG